MPDLRPSLGTSLAKIANRALRRGLFEVIALGIDRMKEEISSTGSLVMFSADPLGVEPRDVPGGHARRATANDADLYARDIGSDSARTFRDRLTEATGCYVVEIQGHLVHASWVTTSKAWTRELRAYVRPPPNHCYVYESFTSPGARGRGIYRFALAHICADAVRRGLKRVWVAVEADNPASLKAVTKAGFERAFEIDIARRFGRLEVHLPTDLPDPAPTFETHRA